MTSRKIEIEETLPSLEQKEFSFEEIMSSEETQDLFRKSPNRRVREWLDVKQSWLLLKESNQPLSPKLKSLMVSNINYLLEAIRDQKESLPLLIIRDIEMFKLIYASTGSSLEKSKQYWVCFLRITYILLFFHKMTLKEIQNLTFDQIKTFLATEENFPMPWKEFLYDNISSLQCEIRELKKRNPKKFGNKDTLLISTPNAHYRSMNRDLKNSLNLLELNDSFSITPRSFLRED